MKKTIFLIIGISALLVGSCKKDYTCKCYLKVYFTDKLIDYNKDTIKTTRKKADKHCADYNLKTKKGDTDSLVCYAYTNNYK